MLVKKQSMLPAGIAAALVGCLALAAEAAGHRFTVTLNYAGNAATNVPMLLKVSPALIDGFSYADTDGTDFEIQDESGVVLPYEIDTWNTSGESLLWVKVPEFANGKALTVTYGRTPFDMTGGATNVWENYIGVWHMNALNASGKYPNSVGEASLDGEISPASTNGQAGIFGQSVLICTNAAHLVSGTEHGGVFIPDGGNLDLSGDITVSGWFKHSTVQGNGNYEFRWDNIFVKRKHPQTSHANNGGSTAGFGVRVKNHVSSATGFELYGSANANVNHEFPSSAIANGTWRHLAFVFEDGGYVGTRLDGAAIARGYVGAVADNDFPLAVGNVSSAYPDNDGDRAWGGYADEVRLIKGAVSADYLAAEYAAMAQADLLQYGALHDAIPTAGDKYHHFTVTVNYEGAAAANVPVLLRLSSAIEGFDYADFIDFGRDMEITDENGNNLPYEIDTWEPDGESLVWVRMPSFENGKTLTVTYGRSTSDGTAQSAAVWSGYSGVWHLNKLDEQVAPYGAYPNSTANAGIDGKKAKRSTAYEPGKFGKSVKITDSTKDDYTFGSGNKYRLCHGGVFVEDPGENSPLDGGGVLTISGWFRHSGVVPDPKNTYGGNGGNPYNYDRLFFKRTKASDNEGGFATQLTNADAPKAEIFGDTSAVTITLSDMTNDWMHVAFVFNGTTYYIVTNGASIKTAGGANQTWTKPALQDNNLPLAIGNCHRGWNDGTNELGDGVGERAWNGWIDEVRVAAGTAHTLDYIAAEYAAMAGNVLQYGAVEEEENDTSIVAIGGVPAFAWDSEAGAMKFSATVTGGKGKVYAEYTDLATGEAATNLVATLSGAETFPLAVSETPTLAANRMYSVAVIAENASGTMRTRTTGDGSVYFGTLAVATTLDADEETLTPGTFRISRADSAEAIVADLAVAFDISGSAVDSGTIYTAITRTATIPAGSAFVDVQIPVLYNTAVTEDTAVSLTLTSATTLNPSASTATMVVVNTDENLHVRYVAATGDDANLGCSPESPKKTIQAAIDAIVATAPSEVCTVHVAPGEYRISSPISISSPIQVFGEGRNPGEVVVTNTATWSGMHRVLYLNHADAMAAGLTLAGGCDKGWNTYGAGFMVDLGGGTVSNCVVRDCSASTTLQTSGGVGGYMMNGLVTHTVFSNITVSADTKNADCALCLTLHGYDKNGVAGRAENCLFADCRANEASMNLIRLDFVGTEGPMQKSTLRNCTVVNCHVGGNGTNVAHESSGKWVTNTTTVCAVAMLGNCEVKNVVAAGNTDKDGNPLALWTNGGQTRYNCFSNCATDGRADGIPVGAGGATASLPATTVKGTTAKFFRNYARGDYRPKIGGPLVNAGAAYDGIPAIDLAGKERVKGASIDIGCYEDSSNGIHIILR